VRVGKSTAPVGLVVITAVNTTFPTKFPVGITVIVDEFPVVAPGASDTGFPLIVNPAATAAFTVRVIVVDALSVPEVPVIVTVV
jgi:hypothetical protein